MSRLTPETSDADVIDLVVRRFGRLWGYHPADREDLAQECWLSLLRSPGRPNYLVCRDACFRANRRALWHRKRDALPPIRTEWAGRPDEVLDIPFLLERLTPRQRQVVQLFYWSHLSFKAIGRRLGVDWTTAATLKRDALAKLRGIYA